MAEKTFPAFPAHAQPAILRIWQEANERHRREKLHVLRNAMKNVARLYWQLSINIKYNHLNVFLSRQDGYYFADGIIKCMVFIENVWISNNILLKQVPYAVIENISALV